MHRGPGSEKIVLHQRFVSGPGGDPMPTECSADLFGFAPVAGRAVVAGFDGGKMTSDAGALLLGATDRAVRLVDRFAECFADSRAPELIEHTVRTLVGQRVFALALGYEDVVDHDELRHDPALAVLAGKLAAPRKDCAPLAGNSTLNRLERGGPELTRYHRIAWDGAKIEALFVRPFLEAHQSRPQRIFLDLDAADEESKLTEKPARRFKAFSWSTRDSWSRQRRVIGKAEWTAGAANPRFIVTSLSPEEAAPQPLYEETYCARGDMENRIKECQLDLFADRTSAATMRANQLRLWFASMAYVLLCALRRLALQHTQFAKATCGMIRLKLMKVGALVRTSVRRIKFAMASGYPYQRDFAHAHAELINAAAP